MFCLFQVKQEVFSVNSYKLLYLQQSWSYCDKISVSVRVLAVVYQTHIWTVSNINSNNVGGSRHGDVWGQDGLETKSGTQHYQFTSA